MTTGQAVANRINKLLKERNMTRYALGKKMGIDNSTVYSLAEGKTNTVRLDTVFIISDALDITIQEFFADPIFNKDSLQY
ncbi:MAG: helix-turn-helix transcriptional regulator [Firmicutes bacterium]|nr:helix-turn-helix transcriptional regulator [Bacillota bacterium]